MAARADARIRLVEGLIGLAVLALPVIAIAQDWHHTVPEAFASWYVDAVVPEFDFGEATREPVSIANPADDTGRGPSGMPYSRP